MCIAAPHNTGTIPEDTDGPNWPEQGCARLAARNDQHRMQPTFERELKLKVG